MRNLILAVTFASTSGMASHFIQCNLKIEVVKVDRLARFNDSTIFSQEMEGRPKSTAEENITLKVNDTSDDRGGCMAKGTELVLSVKKDEVGSYKVGDLFTVHYRNVGDFAASNVTYRIIK